MKFVSTRSPEGSKLHEEQAFEKALFQGLAPDGGLYRPAKLPDLRELILGFDQTGSFVDLATAMTAALFPNEISLRDAATLAERAFPFSPRLVRQEEDLSILELFHGPSHAFKDFGASYLAACMEHFLSGKQRRAVILTATSGDTGSAVAQAFYRRQNIDVLILYPSGRVSPGQEKQLTTLGDNIHALEVRGSFDDCQRMVKEAFSAPELSHLPLTSANSINIGRLIPQSFYYIYALSQIGMNDSSKFFFVVPSGNFGNLTAAVYAWQWGLPVAGFIAATNKNDIVPQYLDSGVFAPRPSLPSYANAMDVGNPSNFERLLAVFNNDWTAMRRLIRASVVSDEEILATMRDFYEVAGGFICPHTATGLLNAKRFKEKGNHLITLATAHPAKFNEIVMQACGREAPVPKGIAESLTKEKHSVLIGTTLNDLVSYLEGLDTNH